MINKKFLFVLLSSILYTVIFNLILIRQSVNDYELSSSAAFAFYSINLGISFALIIPIFYILIDYLAVFSFIWSMSAVSAYFIYFYKVVIDYQIIASFYEANSSEIMNFVNLRVFAFFVVSIIIAFVIWLGAKKYRTKAHESRRIKFISIIFVIVLLLGDSHGMANYLPYNFLKYSIEYFFSKLTDVNAKISVADQYSLVLENEAKDLNIILIIGESARSDHFSLSGYYRETNPNLEKEKNLIFYPNVEAYFPLTRVALPCMLTRASCKDRNKLIQEKSFISIFKKLGFETYWIGTQGSRSVVDAPYMELAQEADKLLLPGAETYLNSNQDELLIKYTKKFINKDLKSPKLIVLHTLGSHFHYEDRYPREFEKFKPICIKKEFFSDMRHCTKEQIINSYDNSILYTDYVISKIIDLVRNKNSIVIYTSDHGESLGENGRYLHGSYGVKEQMSSEMIIWVSNEYIKKFPNNLKSLKFDNKKEISHDYLFHSILGCSGITSDIIEQDKNLCHHRNSLLK